MSDDWQDAAFSSRHMHNRRGSKSTRGTFDVRKTYGTYEVKCPAWQKLESVSTDDEASMELYRLTENQEGVVGELNLSGALRAAILLAASRQSLRRTIEEMEATSDEDENEDEEDSEEDAASLERNRFETFEKNSFRTPKFWLRWSGLPISTTTTTSSSLKAAGKAASSADSHVESGMGYIVFSGNDCRKFKGTISCDALGFKDVAISGHKVAGRSESDIPVAWGRDAIAINDGVLWAWAAYRATGLAKSGRERTLLTAVGTTLDLLEACISTWYGLKSLSKISGAKHSDQTTTSG